MRFIVKDHTAEELAKEFETNTTYLSKYLKEVKGTNFTQYLNKLRINYIIEKLETDPVYLSYTIEGLSQSCGYNSVQTFNRAFEAHTKMKASEFLKQLKNS